MNKPAISKAAMNWLAVSSMVSPNIFKVYDPDPNRFMDVDLTNNAKQPVKSTYAAKQRKRKRKSRRK